MRLKIKGQDEEEPTYLRLVHDASGNVYLEASNDDGLCICILSVEGDGTIRMFEANAAELKKLGFRINNESDTPAKVYVQKY